MTPFFEKIFGRSREEKEELPKSKEKRIAELQQKIQGLKDYPLGTNELTKREYVRIKSEELQKELSELIRENVEKKEEGVEKPRL